MRYWRLRLILEFSSNGRVNMKNIFKTSLLIMALSIMMTSCDHPSPTECPLEPDENFAILFAYGSCAVDIMDTFNLTFTKEITPESDVSGHFELSREEMKSIYQKMVEINFFNYPDKFSVPISKNDVVGSVSPAMGYRIIVRNGETMKYLFWSDSIIDPTSEEADHLRELFQLIINIIEEKPAYKELPDREFRCM
jgi:hypothetical protein